ncbi:SDR family oxidoreductase [Kribbella sandramycini]|uniref:NAD(P)-dependent dehydrogenase (Short-subunit alcohol dehydrogenase family) n=1 Tax=Kribbella sandramycini TaxID=60450 RepID=A0A7Y4L5Y6_9ACTN|nr:SDR family oxidoreductase [Kribbella sandramycini]MBB6565991.1 NAD(P)-dependent dehydrogenase (short-subunit alcohol dehydrogenase family) [Kribbella sandramycini]NOL44993.1 SDR family oxidoreductase [Kribbella sandramycini]
MSLDGLRVLVTGAGRDTGRLLALAFGARGAQVLATARTPAAAEQTAELVRAAGGSATAAVLDLSEPESVAGLAVEHLDVLVNSGAQYLGETAEPTEIADAIAGAATGTVLLTERLLPLLRASGRGDIVNLISAAGEVGQHRSSAHAAFYAAKHAQAGYAEILSERLRPDGVRVISLFPPDFVQHGPRETGAELTAQSVVDCVLFAVGQPRDCFIRAFHFEQRVPRR